MPLAYAFKHVFRSWKLFLALLVGITLASTFLAGVDIKANVTAREALEQTIGNIHVDMTARIHSSNSTQILQAKEKTSEIEGVADVEIISGFWEPITLFSKNDSMNSYARIIGITDNSHVYKGWLNKPTEGIGENETYVTEDSEFASKVKPGDVIQVTFSAYNPYGTGTVSIPFNLTVRGLAELDEKAYSIAHGYYSSSVPLIESAYVNLLLVDWEKTMREVFKIGWLDTDLLIYLDRDALIAPWDIGTSINNIESLRLQIENKLAELGLYMDVRNNLEEDLLYFQIESMIIRVTFTLVSLPIFFMAWYMGTTVSDVSFNLRRREIGLLSTKGFSRRQLLTTFLTETLLIGVIGGALGLLFGFLLNPLFTQFSAEAFLNPQVISPYTMIFTIAFGVIIAFLSAFSSARKASKLKAVDALREYLPTELEKPYKKRWPMIALILGTYKIAVFILGVNMSLELTRITFGTGNFILILLAGIWLIIDAILNYIGPLLFFWGFMKIFIQGSLKFQELTAKATRFLGDLSALATKNVRRNPARSAAIAFLLALIVGYSVQVTGQLASEQDHAVRNVYYQVGSDVAIYVSMAKDAPNILNVTLENVSEKIQNTTIEYSFSSSTSLGIIKLKAVNPQSWLETAYYEHGWFSGSDLTTAFNKLATESDTIILERSVAAALKLEIGGNITLNFGSATKTLEVVGFFGPEPSDQQQPIIVQQIFTRYWSFISESLYEEISSQVSASAKILLKLKSDADGKTVAENIRNLKLNVSLVESFAEEWEEAQSDVITIGLLDVQRLGVVFAVLAASVGTVLVSAVSMKERSREAAIMSVKGLSYKHLVIVFLTEIFALVLFSVILGIVVGFIVVHGNISAANTNISYIIQRRLVLPLDTILMLTSCIALIFISTVSPILILLRRYMTKLERMVRLR